MCGWGGGGGGIQLTIGGWEGSARRGSGILPAVAFCTWVAASTVAVWAWDTVAERLSLCLLVQQPCEHRLPELLLLPHWLPLLPPPPAIYFLAQGCNSHSKTWRRGIAFYIPWSPPPPQCMGLEVGLELPMSRQSWNRLLGEGGIHSDASFKSMPGAGAPLPHLVELLFYPPKHASNLWGCYAHFRHGEL